jgi:hypothetical protein
VLGLSASERHSRTRTTTVSIPATLRFDRTATVGPARFSYPSTWRPQPANHAPGPGLAFTVATTVASTTVPRGQLTVGTTSSRGGTTPLPTAFIAAQRLGSPTPQLVSLGGRRFTRVLDPRLPLGAMSQSVYAVASGTGAVVALCRTRSQTFVGLCERVLATLSAPPARAPVAKPPAAKVAYAQALNAILARLNAARASGARQLGGAQVALTEAAAARTLALAHAEAATAVAELSSGPPTANAALLTALRRLSVAYRQLADAAAVVAPVTYNADRKLVDADNAALAAALSRLRALGYTVG